MTPATRTLPTGYELYRTLDLSKDRRTTIILSIVATVSLLPVGFMTLVYIAFFRPESSPVSGTLGLGGIVLIIAVLIAATVVMVVIHEGVHAIGFWLITHDRPQLGFRGMYAFAGAADWYLPRMPYLFVALGPLVVITLAGLALILIVPEGLIPLLFFIIVFNASGAIGDLAVFGWLLTQPASTFIRDTGDAFSAYRLGR